MKAFVTGGTGFIGRHLVRQLVGRGYEVHALARSAEGLALVEALGAQGVLGDITAPDDSMRAAMSGSDVLFHVAAWYKVGDSDWLKAEEINVGGTRHMLQLAHELGVPKIIYTSTTAVFGDTHGQLVDETYYQEGPFATEYERTKWLAHYRVAVPLMQAGAPIIVVLPGGVYGPGDESLVGELMRRFYLAELPFPFLPGPETVLTYAHVADVAEGHILAAEKGRVGQSYILAGPAVPLGEMVQFWSQLTGKRLPLMSIPAWFLRQFTAVQDTLEHYLPTSPLFSAEMLRMLGTTYIARADKAKLELGWKPRSLQAGMLETLGSIAASTTGQSHQVRREQRLGQLALLTAVILFVLWLRRYLRR